MVSPQGSHLRSELRETICSPRLPRCRLPSFSSASEPVMEADRSAVAGHPFRGGAGQQEKEA